MSEDMERAEILRKEAEHEREEHELRRRIAEGGPDQHVPGDIISPPGRFEAEIAREARVQRIYPRIVTLLAIPLALIVVVPLGIGFYFWRDITNDRIRDSEAQIARVDHERRERALAINEFAFEQCIQAEIRDVVQVQQARAFLAILRRVEQTPETREAITVLQDSIVTLEPVDEPDCVPPPP